MTQKDTTCKHLVCLMEGVELLWMCTNDKCDKCVKDTVHKPPKLDIQMCTAHMCPHYEPK